MRRVLIDGIVSDESDEGVQDVLSRAYRGKKRPYCLCSDPPVPMYIADVGNQLVIKRMPLSGARHDPGCPSYEPPYELSGLGQLIGGAIKLDPSLGTATLKLGFSLSKRGGATRGDVATAQAADSVKTESRKLSLRGLLHFLWHESGLTEWTSHWAGKRHWWQVYHHLAEAAGQMDVRGEKLVDRLFIPEPFRVEDKSAIEQRRAQRFASLFQGAAKQKKLMLLVAEVKEFTDARGGQQIVIKNMPGFRLHLEEAAWKSLQRRFETELMLWQSSETSHLLSIMTLDGSRAGLVTVNEIALMTVTEQWLPIETAYEQVLVERLVRLRAKSIKGLRYSLPHDEPLANAILPEAKPKPCALYIVPPDADTEFEGKLLEMMEARPDVTPWVWYVKDGQMPELPV